MEVKKGQLYQHYKGNQYKILGVGKHSETLEEVVIYQDLAEEHIWVRPYDMFIESVKLEDGTIVPRFQLLNHEQ